MANLKILFIGGQISPTPSANAINTLNIIEELENKGHEVHYISINKNEMLETDPLSRPTYYIKSSKFSELLQLSREKKLNHRKKLELMFLSTIRKFKNVYDIKKFPDVEPKQSMEIYELIKKLHQIENFDCVIGVFRPFSGVSASIKIKERYPELICGAYYLDLISGSSKPTFLPSKLYEKIQYKGEINAFKKLDFLLMAKGGKNIYNQKYYESISSKLHYVDFPVFKPKNINYEINFDNSKINLVYAGTLNKNYRNPTNMLEVLKNISNTRKDITLHLYGRGNCGDIINEYKKIDSFDIVDHGMVRHDEVRAAMKKSNIMINISNTTPNIVPSKIFELFSSGKPIINFYSESQDISLEYFAKYPSVLNISTSQKKDEQIINILKFIEKEKEKEYNVELIKNLFIENTPEFTVNILENLILKKGYINENK